MAILAPVLIPVLYLGAKPVPKAQTVPGTPAPVVFDVGPDYAQPYAYVKEAEAQYLSRVAPDLFSFPGGLKSDGGIGDLIERITTLEAQVAFLVGDTNEAAPRKRRTKAKMTDQPTTVAEIVA